MKDLKLVKILNDHMLMIIITVLSGLAINLYTSLDFWRNGWYIGAFLCFMVAIICLVSLIFLNETMKKKRMFLDNLKEHKAKKKQMQNNEKQSEKESPKDKPNEDEQNKMQSEDTRLQEVLNKYKIKRDHRRCVRGFSLTTIGAIVFIGIGNYQINDKIQRKETEQNVLFLQQKDSLCKVINQMEKKLEQHSGHVQEMKSLLLSVDSLYQEQKKVPPVSSDRKK